MNKVKTLIPFYPLLLWSMLCHAALFIPSAMAADDEGIVLQDVQILTPSERETEVRLTFNQTPQLPQSFPLLEPPRMVFDFHSVRSALTKRETIVNKGGIRSFELFEVSKRLRVTFTFEQMMENRLKLADNIVVIHFKRSVAAKPSTSAPSSNTHHSNQYLPEVEMPITNDFTTNKEAQSSVARIARELESLEEKSTNERPKGTQEHDAAQAVDPNLAEGNEVVRVMSHESTELKNQIAAEEAPTTRQIGAVEEAVTKPEDTLVSSNIVPAKTQVNRLPSGDNQPVEVIRTQANLPVAQIAIQPEPIAAQNPVAQPAAPAIRPAQPIPTPAITTSMLHIRNLDFRREENGGGRVILELPSPNTKVKVEQRGRQIVALIKDVDVPPQLQKKLDVLDFATPVKTIELMQKGGNAKLKIACKGFIEHQTVQNGNQYVIYVTPVTKKMPSEQGVRKKDFKGEKLSLNFQDIEVRAVLQLIADFTNLNIVVSDTVQGNITLRLKNVPWDQALDIVLETKGLAKRENGNVIWVAPAEELSRKEQELLEASQKKKALEPLYTEYIRVNFASADDLVRMLKESKAQDPNDPSNQKSHSLLSSRGSVSVDRRTNTLIIQDTSKKLREVREMIKALDIPVQQVLIESRIVTANDQFTKNLGMRFGVTGAETLANGQGAIGISGSGAAADTMINQAAGNIATTQQAAPVGIPSYNDRLNINMPIAEAFGGKFGIAVLAKDYLLDLELSALQAESKGEVIATPRVITANKSEAKIEQGVEIPYQQAAGDGATSISFKKAVLSLSVLPQITPDEHIIMLLKISQDSVGQLYAGVPSINTREIQTQVVVENGQTVVLGGVHEEIVRDEVDKVPVLGDLPLMGPLFRQTRKRNDKQELLIFVTPKIMDDIS